MLDRPLTAPPPEPDLQAGQAFGRRLGPALTAALMISWLLVLQEIMSDLLPFFGSLLTLPAWMFLYYLQGLLVGYLARRDPGARSHSTLHVTGLGIVSAFWSGIVISSVISLLGLGLSTLLTAGAAALTIPLMLPGMLLDFFLNLVLTTLGAWIYAHRSGRHLLGISCSIGLLLTIAYCMLVTVLIAVLAAGGFKFLLPYLQQFHLPSLPIGRL
jgi:hypothetical protein